MVNYLKDWVVEKDSDKHLVFKLPDVSFGQTRKGGVKTDKIVRTTFKVIFDIVYKVVNLFL